MANKRRLEPPENLKDTTTVDVNEVAQLRHMRVIEKIRDAVIKLGCPNLERPLSDEKMKFIGEHIRQIYPVLQTPSHPPYTALIEGAIMKLNDNGGSSEEAISEFIKVEYGDQLPWAHKRYLSYHLGKLVDDKEIVVNIDGHYSIPVENPDFKCKIDLGKELLLLPQPKRRGRRSERQARRLKHKEIEKRGETNGREEVSGLSIKQNHSEKELIEEENQLTAQSEDGVIKPRGEINEELNEKARINAKLNEKASGLHVKEIPLKTTHGRRKQSGIPATLMIASPELKFRSRSFLEPKADFGYHCHRLTRSEKKKLMDLIKPSETQVKSVEELPIEEELLQQELQHCPTLPTLNQALDKIAKLKQALDKITREALPSGNQSDHEQPQLQPQPQHPGRTSRSEQLKNTDEKMLEVQQNCHSKSPEGKSSAQNERLPSEQNEEQLQQLPRRGRGWPPKKKLVMDSEKLLALESDVNATIKISTAQEEHLLSENEQNEEQLQQPPRHGHGRPPKKKLVMNSTTEKPLPLKPDLDGKIKISLPSESDIGITMDSQLCSPHFTGIHHHHDQQQKPRRRGRPPKKLPFMMTSLKYHICI
ncbi:Linker histone H1/H5, domain H15 [Dillenia turbinata]|uniref:Linker histone H1/H5, domain H15 n=1 Tax=Dillenia turbinata TaxID=194707 RepID=A0AAN8VG54_9MAGN